MFENRFVFDYGWISAVCCASLLAIATGCSSGRYVMRNGDRGIVAIPANTNSWPTRNWDHATELMSQHFPEGFEIEHEEEVVIGQTTSYGENLQNDVAQVAKNVTVHSGTTSGTATTTDKTEYRIHYRRR